MKYNLVVDVREIKLIEQMETISGFIFEKRALDIGDIIFENEEKQIIALIERKTVADLMASIQDGRYKEQKLRIKNCCNGIKIYIIEGSDTSDAAIENKIESVNVSLSMQGMSMIRTENGVEGTIRIIEKIKKKVSEMPQQPLAQVQSQNYSDVIKVKKKKNVTPEVCMISQLSQIVGISVNTAKVIISRYSTIVNLVELYKNEGKHALALLQVSDTRKLGAKKSEEIYINLFGGERAAQSIKKSITKQKVENFLLNSSSNYKKGHLPRASQTSQAPLFGD